MARRCRVSAVTEKEKALRALMDAGRELQLAVRREHEALYARPIAKIEAIERIMRSGDNPLTGKPHSASSAETFVERDAEYTDRYRMITAAVLNRMDAEAKYDIARFEAEFAVGVAVRQHEAIGV